MLFIYNVLFTSSMIQHPTRLGYAEGLMEKLSPGIAAIKLLNFNSVN